MKIMFFHDVFEKSMCSKNMRIKFGQALTATPCSEKHQSTENSIMNAERLHLLSEPSYTRHARTMHAKRFRSKSFMSAVTDIKPPPGIMVLPSHGCPVIGHLAGTMTKLSLGAKKHKKKTGDHKPDEKHMSRKIECMTNIMLRHGLDWHEEMGWVSFKVVIFVVVA